VLPVIRLSTTAWAVGLNSMRVYAYFMNKKSGEFTILNFMKALKSFTKHELRKTISEIRKTNKSTC